MTVNSPTTPGQILTSAYVNNMPRGVISGTLNTVATLTVASTTETELFRGPAFTPAAGRLYRCTYSVGQLSKTTAIGNINIKLRKDSTAGTVLNDSVFSALDVGVILPFSTSILLTTTEMGTALFTPLICLVANTTGFTASNTGGYNGTLVFEDIGAA
jgi:endoglucanase Acf2